MIRPQQNVLAPTRGIENVLLREHRAARLGPIVWTSKVWNEQDPAAPDRLGLNCRLPLIEIGAPGMKEHEHRPRRHLAILITRDNDVRVLQRAIERAAELNALTTHRDGRSFDPRGQRLLSYNDDSKKDQR